MAWECNSDNFCECGHVAGFIHGKRPMVKTQVMQALNDSGEQPSYQTTGWMALVNRYSERNFSFPADKLKAIAGLAEVLATERTATDPSFSMDAIYTEGIFRRGLPEQLLWITANGSPGSPASPVASIHPDSRPGRRLSPCNTATWSWASIDGQVTYQNDIEIVSSLVDIHDSVDSTTFDEIVSSRYLTLEGLAMPVALRTYVWEDGSGMETDTTNSSVFMGPWVKTIMRTPSGMTYAIFYDEGRPVDLENGDADFHCWTRLDWAMDLPTDSSEDSFRSPHSRRSLEGSVNSGTESADFSMSWAEFDSNDSAEDIEGGEEEVGSDDGDGEHGLSELGESIETESVRYGESADEKDLGCDSWCDKCLSDGGILGATSLYWCLRIAIGKRKRTDKFFLFCLILYRSAKGRDVWERVGLGQIPISEGEDDLEWHFQDGIVQRIRLI
ncbi:hypothetical protein CEP54_016089 [Fusarium duplospermum]|uniref:Uncharacterized protein n=1 Tax=Fusarium duplospermum TaxID=1325734 RepID=A0A428NIC2_9HYPO|nr:hypothetical protein CEP54_016089 [Fusarium duplospermum]